MHQLAQAGAIIFALVGGCSIVLYLTARIEEGRMNLSLYRKAIVSAVVAGLTALVAALSDGTIDGQEVGGIVGALLAGGGLTYAVPNARSVP